ncbi:hypothetical protein [Methylobacterium soli]|uniref:Uncharacterized protein n=1 Tax=Methylobacterium soli TaxID=553447 RepID=A0A6L3T018_9HYPH|nr:hypothetical protein [Methylobacterium soli]KAB1078244.1 hypothetical protein F6X53_15950 [Methylobacterium soli]GJE45544.1 hypothetical protein AEGHOMDF_4743 [Methylobacterium soli]
MSTRRQISWTTALADMRNDRVQVAPGQIGATLRANAYAKFTADRLRAARPVLVIAGRYDRAAIMRAAIQQAQSRRAVTGEAWSICLSAALKGVWSVAKAARIAAAH